MSLIHLSVRIVFCSTLLGWFAVNLSFAHPIMKGFPTDYKSAMDELYIIEKVWPNTTVLATSKSETKGDEHPVFWTNQYGKARVFGTTYGHSKDTFSDKVFLAALVNGIVWAGGR